MDVIEVINQNGVVVVLCGLLACVICGFLKIPIARAVRAKYSDSKVIGDKIRNACTLIVAVLSVAFVAIWYVCVSGVNVFLQTKVYAEMLAAFTTAKVMYMIYEGFDKASIKKLIHSFLNKRNTKVVDVSDVSKSTNITEYLQAVLLELHLPLTVEQKLNVAERLKNHLGE